MIYQVALKKDGDSWAINSNGESKITINKVFLLAIEKYNELKVEGIEEEYEKLSKETIKDVLEKLNKFGLYFDVNFEKLEKVNEYTAKNLPKYNFGAGRLVENLVIGQFPLANSIYKDYEELIESDLNSNLLESLLKTGDNPIADFEKKEEHGRLSFSENDLFLISQLDYSQELAVKKGTESDKLVIYGPPGTGKSQTITNIISNNIASGKKVLMVSQKRAALDVIYNRLGDLNSKAIIIHDVNADKKRFYSSVSASLGLDSDENSNYSNDIDESSKFIDEKILKLEKLAKVLNIETEMGLTLQELYSKSKVIESKLDLRFDKFMRYRKFASKEGFDKFKYDELVSNIEKIDTTVINAFAQYKELVGKNSEIDNINVFMTTIEISEAMVELENILEKEELIKNIKEEDKFIFDSFWKEVDGKERLSIDRIKHLAKIINEDKNKELMIKSNIGEWWILDKENKEEYDYLNSFLDKKKYEFTQANIDSIADVYNNKKNSNLKIKLNEGNWWKCNIGDEELKKFVYFELNSSTFKFDEIELVAKITKFHMNNNQQLLEKLNDKPWWKQIFSYSKNKRHDERIFDATLEEYKKDGVKIAEDIVSKYFENINKEKENLVKFELVKSKYRVEFLKLADEISKTYFDNIKKDKENEIELEKRYQSIYTVLNSFNLYLEEELASIEIMRTAFNEEKFASLQRDILNKNLTKENIEILIDSLNMLDNYGKELIINKELSELQRKVLENSISADGSVTKEDIEYIIEFSILQNILKLEKELEIKEAIEYIDEFESIVDLTNEKMRLKQELVKQHIIISCQKEIESLKFEFGYKEFKRQADKKRALWPIRKYMENYSEEVLSVFPCFLLGPETVSNILPLIKGLFDVVIFDEASQMYIEEAIPTIYRAKKVIIAGDDKQLRPSGTFKSTINSEVDDEEEEVEDLAALEEESLLDLAKINYDKVHLTYHYRSKYEELISFSNYAFYDGRLKISPNIISDNNEFKPIERIKCDGKWIDRANIEEATEVVNLVYKTLLERKNNETIGIITFNISQKSVIEDMLEQKAQEDSIFRELYIKELERIENSEDVSLFVKNIENVQGDERDIIIFSIAYGRNENGRISVNFGSLSKDGGENRLNVAISRAKQKIYVVTSVEPEELNVESAKNRGPRLFKKYLQYARAISNGNRGEVESILNSLIDSDIVKNEERKHDSDFEAEVYDALVEKGYEVHTQIGVSGYKIDMAIYDKEKDKYILGIECDGAAFHSSKSARERDIHRQRYLESRGWKITRVWSRHWWKNPSNEISKIEKMLNPILNMDK